MKVKNLALTGIMLVVMLAAPLLALAQDDDEMVEINTEDWVEFVSEDELFTVRHPAGWFASPDPDSPTTLIVVNSEALIETFNDDDSPAQPGDKIVGIIGLLPADFLPLLGIEVAADSATQGLIEGIAKALGADSDGSEGGGAEFGEIDVVEVSDELEIGTVEVISEAQEFTGYFFAYELEGIVVVGTAATHIDELDAEFKDVAIEILASLKIGVTAEELLALME